jgi:glyoxylase-like metal-dependent hydrolase (beta-lactamase superfamily II)
MSKATPLQFGDVSVQCIEESVIPLFDPLDFYAGCTPEILARESHWLDTPRYRDPATGFIQLTMQSFLLHSNGRRILVDTCVGNCKNRVRPLLHQLQTPWLENLRAAGIEPEQIDVVVSTHLHVDHVGWHSMLKDGRWVPTFPNARYLFAKDEFDYFTRPEAAAIFARNGDYWSDSIKPVLDAGLADFVAMDHRIDANLVLEPTPGDTLGHVALRIDDSGRDLAIFTGDLIHHLLQVKFPAWSSRYASDPQQATVTREKILARYADTDVVFFPAHFPAPTAGRVKRDNHGYRYVFIDGRDDFARNFHSHTDRNLS